MVNLATFGSLAKRGLKFVQIAGFGSACQGHRFEARFVGVLAEFGLLGPDFWPGLGVVPLNCWTGPCRRRALALVSLGACPVAVAGLVRLGGG